MPSALASRFANALADAVLSPGASMDPVRALVELRSFEQMVKDTPELKNVLLSPAVATAKKRGVITQLAQVASLSPLIRNFLFVVVDRRRAGILHDIATAFESALDERMGYVRADVRSAVPLSTRHQADLEQELSRVAGKRVRLHFQVDPALIGGVVARIGSTVYDGSVRTQLEQMRERLVAR
ncbi:MAG TPA: ATP synthase F1 subunit delta [Bryobacteraceae bacterium]|nr:ATP synthase F1 subunit delta [Bryobacteraceae bacterium]